MSKEKQPKDPAEQGNEIKTAADLIQDEHNYRKHSDTNKARIRKSIDEAGLGRSVVVDADGVLVAGNGVQQVIDKDTPVRVVETDGTELVVVKRTDLHTGDPRRKTLALADNATADDVEWDFDTIADDWTEDEAGEWGVEWPADEEKIEQKEAQEDDFDPDKPVETVCKKGDIWKLGNHRLMCGDSTDAASVALLMDGEKAPLTFTDPPYRLETEGGGVLKTANSMKQIKDNGVDEFEPDKLTIYSKTNIYCHNKPLIKDYILLAEREGMAYDLCIYKKQGLPNYKGHMMTNIEYIAIIGEQGPRQGLEFQTYSKVYEGKKDNGNELSYSKPVGLCAKFIQLYSAEGDIVLDLFGGSGTTIIAAEQLNRKCYMMELDPHYCDVIIARWEKLTGNKAEKLK